MPHLFISSLRSLNVFIIAILKSLSCAWYFFLKACYNNNADLLRRQIVRTCLWVLFVFFCFWWNLDTGIYDICLFFMMILSDLFFVGWVLSCWVLLPNSDRVCTRGTMISFQYWVCTGIWNLDSACSQVWNSCWNSVFKPNVSDQGKG